MDLQGGWRKLHVLFALSICRFESSDHCPVFSHIRTSFHHHYVELFWVLLQVQVPSSGSETIECGVCQHPFLVSAHWVQINIIADGGCLYACQVLNSIVLRIYLFHINNDCGCLFTIIFGFVAWPNFTCILLFFFFSCFNLVCFFRLLLPSIYLPPCIK